MFDHFKQHKALTLLVSLLVLILTSPLFETSKIAGVCFVFLYTTVLLAGVYAISYDVRYIAIGILLVAPILVCRWSNIILNSPEIDLLERACSVVFMSYTLSALLKRVFAASRVGLNEVYASIAAYILIGMVFGSFYWLLETIAPGSFHFTYSRQPHDAAPFIFFSFTALAGGGSDIIAVAPFARSLSLLEVLIGVIYVAVLIGRLVSALSGPQNENDSLVAPETYHEKKTLRQLLNDSVPLKKRPIGLILSAVMLNFAASLLMIHVRLPFFFDSLGTSLAVILGGWWAGAATALTYHILISATYWGWESWIWVFSSLLVAGLTWFFVKRGWVSIYRLLHLIATGFVIGILNSILVQILIVIAKLPPYQGTLPVYSFFLKALRNQTLAAFVEKIFVEIADKTLSIMIAAVAAFLLRDFIATYQKNLSKSQSKKK